MSEPPPLEQAALVRLEPFLEQLRCEAERGIYCKHRVTFQHMCRQVDGQWVRCTACALYVVLNQAVSPLEQVAYQHGSVYRAHFETLRERCEAAETALEARTQERDNADRAVEQLNAIRNAEVGMFKAAKDAAEARVQALEAERDDARSNRVRYLFNDTLIKQIQREMRGHLGPSWPPNTISGQRVQEWHDELKHLQPLQPAGDSHLADLQAALQGLAQQMRKETAAPKGYLSGVVAGMIDQWAETLDTLSGAMNRIPK